MPTRGVIVSFEGLDRAGKTTQCGLLAEYLKVNNIKFHHYRFPDFTTPTGKALERYLTDIEFDDINPVTLHYLFSANRWERQAKILEHINAGEHVIIDRYAHSGVAYTISRGIDINWALRADEGILAPDVIFHFDADPEILAKRKDFGNGVHENVNFQKTIRKSYKSISDIRWHYIDATKNKDDIHTEIVLKFHDTVKWYSDKKYYTLWLGSPMFRDV